MPSLWTKEIMKSLQIRNSSNGSMKLHVVTFMAEVHQLPRLDTYETAWALICNASFALC